MNTGNIAKLFSYLRYLCHLQCLFWVIAASEELLLCHLAPWPIQIISFCIYLYAHSVRLYICMNVLYEGPATTKSFVQDFKSS